MFLKKREETLPTLFWILCNPDTKTRQTHCKKRKLQTNIHNKHKCKNYSNIKQLNPAIQKKNLMIKLGLSQEYEIGLTFQNQLT